MLTRIATAIVLLIIAYVWLFIVDYPIFTIGALLLYMICAYEMGPLLGYKSKNYLFVLIATVVSTLSFVFFPPGLYIESGEIPKNLLTIIYISWLIWPISIYFLKQYPKNTSWHNNKVFSSIIAILLLWPFLQCTLILRSINYANDPHTGSFLLLSVMALVWCADSGAYFVGRFFGKRKLLESVSPKKTLEGVYGGIFVAFIAMVIFAYYNFYSVYQDNLIVLALSGIFTIIFSIIGDLVESLFKRIANIKDSGKILPGHGGLLDRLDSQLAALPTFVTLNAIFSWIIL